MTKKGFARYVLVAWLLMLLTTPAKAVDVTEYKVASGDTLWGISKRALRDPFLWPALWKLNPNIKNPDRIYPDQIIRVPVFETEAGKTDEEMAMSKRQISRESVVSSEQRHDMKTGRECVPAAKTSAPDRFEGIRGVILYSGKIIPGRILSMNATQVVLRTENDAILSFSFVDEIEDFIKE